MKLKVTQSELNECISNAFKRVLSEGKTNKKNGFEKGFKSANRDIERDIYGDGFKSYDKPHKTKKDYSRKGKNKFSYDENLDEGVIDFTHPDDEYYDDGYDTEYIPDINDIEGFQEMDGDDEKKEPMLTIKTDIEKVEGDLIGNILEEYPDAEYDVVDGYVSFNIPKRIKKVFKKYLEDNDVTII